MPSTFHTEAALVTELGEGKWGRVAGELNVSFAQHQHKTPTTASYGALAIGITGGDITQATAVPTTDGWVGRRTAKQCRERWLHHLKPDITKKVRHSSCGALKEHA